MGYLLEDGVLWRFSPPAQPGITYPEGEDSLSFYSGQGAFELEYVSPMMRLNPGESRSTRQTWLIEPPNPVIPGKYDQPDATKSIRQNHADVKVISERLLKVVHFDSTSPGTF